MTVFVLGQNVTAVQSAPPYFIDIPGAGATPWQAFQTIVKGVGSVTAIVQPVGSNDPFAAQPTPTNQGTWVNIGTAYTVTGAGDGIGVAGGTTSIANWAYYGAIVTTITGTVSSITTTMNV